MSLLTGAVDMFFGTAPSSSLAGVRVDAMMSEQLTLDSLVSQYPRENGSPFTDGIIPELPTLSLEGIVTTAGVMFLDGLLSTGSFAPLGESKLVAARKALETVHKNRMPVTLVTSGITYLQYGMASCSITRRGNGDDGELQISARFVKMPTVQLQTTTVSVVNTSNVGNTVKGKAGTTKANAGQVGGTEATVQSTPSPSAAKALFDWLRK